MKEVSATTEPKEFSEEMYRDESIERLSDFLELVKPGTPWRIPTERLIRLNGNFRRGKYVNQQINDRLKEFGLICSPEIDSADYYGSVIISDPRDRISRQGGTASLPLSAFPNEFGYLISCRPETPLEKIQTIMVSNDISQLPVLNAKNDRVFGVVTWKSLVQGLAVSQDPKIASDVMGPVGHVASSNDDFLDLVDTIISQDYVLYRVPGGTVNGIVTASDLAMAFNGTASKYVRLQELESRLRILLDKAPLPKLRDFLESKRRNMKKFRGATDMMFGEYLSALQDQEIWGMTGIYFDQTECLKLLDSVREARNDVMHFSTSADDETEAERKQDAAIVRALRILRASTS